MATKSKQIPTKRGSTAATLRMSPFRVTVKKVPGGFTARFDGIRGNRLVPWAVDLEFPKWWANHLIQKLNKVK